MNLSETYVPYDGGTLWTCTSGPDNNPVILLCNGGPGCCDYLEPVADMLNDQYRVIRFEQRGCGRSTADGSYDLTTTVEDIERIREHYGVKKWIVGGHSWGANLAFVYAMTYPERVQALLYISGNGIQNDRHWSEEYTTATVMNAANSPLKWRIRATRRLTLKEIVHCENSAAPPIFSCVFQK